MSSISGAAVASTAAETTHAVGPFALLGGSSLTDQQRDHLDGIIFRVRNSVVVSGLIGCLFSSVGLVGGVLYGAVSSLSSVAVEWIYDKEGYSKDSTEGKTLRIVISLIVSIAAGCFALAVAGFAWAPGAIVAIEVGSRGLFLLAAAVLVSFGAYALATMDADRGSQN